MAEDSLSDLERSDPELLEEQAKLEKTQEEVVEPVGAPEPPPAEEVVETEPETPPVAEPTEEPQMVSKDRFDELNDRLKTSDERNDELMRMMLEGGHQKQEPPEPPPPEIDPDVAALVDPIVEARVEAKLEAERQQYSGVQDLIAERNQQRAIETAKELLPKELDVSGITWNEVAEEWHQMPKQVQPQLDNVGGIAFLMQRIATRAAPPVKDENLAALSHRSHTGGESKAPLQAPKVTAQEVYNMTEEEFAKFAKGRTRETAVDDPNYVDPLLR